MKYQIVNLTFWEDDAEESGNDATINKNNNNKTKEAEVKRGIAETIFMLSPSFAKMGETQKTEDATHKYYITASIATEYVTSCL